MRVRLSNLHIQHIQAPSVSLSNIESFSSNSYYSVTLSGGTSTNYYYQIENENKVNFSNVSTTPRIYVVGSSSSTNRFSVSSYLSSTGDQVNIYFYIGDDDTAPATKLTITRTGTSDTAFSYDIVKEATIKIPTGQTSSVTSEAGSCNVVFGRVDGNNYEFYWFGPMRAKLDGWLSGFSPSYSYNESREHYEIGYAPYGMNGIQDMATGASVTNAARGAAAVARCIREYDNVATANE